MQPVSDSIVPDTGRRLKVDLHPITLSFQGELENRFRENYHLDSLATVRLALLFGFILFGLGGIPDALSVPEMTVRLWTIRFAVVAPFFIAVLALSYSAVFKMLFQFSVAASMIVAGSALIYTTVIVPPPANQPHYAGLMLVLLWGYTVTRLRFVWAATAGWILVILNQIVAVLVLQNSFAVLLNDTFFLVGSNLVGMFACYLIERYARRIFYQALVLCKEQEKVKIVNRRLKKIATERTAQLLTKNRELFEETEERQKAENRYNELATRCCPTQEKEPVVPLGGNAAQDFKHLMTAIQAHISVLLIRTPREDPAYEKLKQVEQYASKGSSLARQLPVTNPFEKHQRNKTHPDPTAVPNSIALHASSRRPDRPEKADETILLVDDDQMIVDIASNMLMRLGYAVLPASNGREALHIYSREKADISLVILDMMMPDMSGAQTLDLLKKENPDIKVLLSSGRSPGDEVGRIVGNGCAGFLQKPYDIDRLSLKIREALDAF